ncbi:MAG: SDR family oxidoreductase [Chloroflexi bacterium]|nr:SDR family oxidoreductase [Chloroflexota bacterium]
MALEGKVAIVTGASQGIGKAVALEMARQGASVVLNARAVGPLEKVASEVASFGGSSLVAAADVTVKEQIDRMVEATIDRFGRIDVLVNNAGGGLRRPGGEGDPRRQLIPKVDEVDEADWDATVALNLKAAFLCAKAVLPHMKRQGKGTIINISSKAGRAGGQVTAAPYASAKAGLGGLSRQIARDMGPLGITCNTVAPGIVMTERFAAGWALLPEARRQELMAEIPLRRGGTPEEIAAVICFLASDGAGYINGTTIDVNGGWFMAP